MKVMPAAAKTGAARTGANLTISVLITNHNYGAFLEACLASVRAQSVPADQIVVVDDGSTDDSRRILRDVGTDVTVVLQEQRGQIGALDTAVAASTGDLLCLLDADDVLLPEKLERVREVFAAHPDVDWLRHRLEFMDRDMRRLGPMIPAWVRTGRLPAHRGMIAERVVTAATSGIVVRRSLARRIFPLAAEVGRPATFTLARDADALLLGRVAAAGAIGYSLTDVLALYRRHEMQMFPGPSYLTRLIERQIEIADAVASELGHPYDNGVRPSLSHKHAMILATLEGVSRWSRRRTREWLRGMRAVTLSLWDRPMAAARQLGALSFAFVAPHTWLRKFHRQQAWTS